MTEELIFVPAQPEQASKKTKSRFKTLLAGFLAGMIFTVSISAASITGYLYLEGRPLPHFNKSNQGVQQASLNGNYQNTQITTAGFSKANTLTIPQIIEQAQDSVVGISSTFNNSRSSGTGTGIIYSEDGKIITNSHVINGAQKIMVTLPDGKTYQATLIGSDTKSDLAILNISAKNLKAATFGDSNKLVAGETAIAIGNPLGLEFAGSATAGIVSALNREVNVDGRYMTFIQTDAAINPGNSGGPLLNSKGEVIGINTVKVTSTDTEGLGFAIPISNALPIIQQLMTNGTITGRPSIGISGEDISAQAAAYYDVPQGFLVRSIAPGSGAEQGGLQIGDLIIAFNGVTVTNQAELNREKDRCAAGDMASIKVYRSTTGQTITLNVVLSESVA